MKKLSLIVISISFLFSSTELHELAGIPGLFAHFADHQSTEHPLSWIDFLVLHYSAHHPADNDDAEDNKLPFKPHGSLTATDPLFTADEFSQNEKIVFAPERILVPDEKIPLNSSSPVFHPPQEA